MKRSGRILAGLVGGSLGSRIGRRLLLSFVSCAIVPLGLLAVLALTSVSSRLQSEADETLRDAAKAAGMSIAERLALLESDLELLLHGFRARGAAVAAGLPPGVRARIERHFRSVAWVSCESPRGQSTVLVGEAFEDRLAPDSDCPHLEAGKTEIESVGGRVLMLRAVDPTDPAQGLLCAAVAPDQLWHSELVQRGGGDLFVVDRASGADLFAGNGRARVPQEVSRRARRDLSDRGAIEWVDEHGEEWVARPWQLYLVPRFGVDWMVVHARPTDALFGPLRDFRWLFVSATGLAFLLVVIVGLVQIRRTLSPIAQLRAATQRIARGDLEREVGIGGDDEFAQLGRSFDEMSRQLLANIRRREKTEAELVAARDAALAAAQTEADFLTNVSHEFRTPLTGILSSAEILQQFVDEDAEIRLEFTETVLQQARQLSRMVDDVIEVGQLRSHDARLERDVVPVGDSLRDALDVLGPTRAERVRIELDDRSLAVLGDRRRLAITWFQLLDNALKFSEDDTPVDVRVCRDGAEAVLEFVDRGAGIAAEHRGEIFERFRQVGRDLMTDKAGGTGLGLSIVREVVEHLGGSIAVESEPGMGSTFRIRLALAPAPRPAPNSVPMPAARA